MEHHIARDLLEGYVEDSLEPATRAGLEEHLAMCPECRSILEGVEAPVRLGNTIGGPAQAWDEKQLRKTIRRTLFRLVFDAISIWIIGALVLTILSAFAIQPLLVDRDDRIRAAAIATWDLPVLATPGARVSAWSNNSTPFGRDLSVDLVRPIGDATRPLGTFNTHLGLVKFSGERGPIFPVFGSDGSRPFTPERLPVDTVVTVQLHWREDPISIPEAEALQPAEGEARIVWVGFDVTPAFPPDPLHPSFEVLGYGTCGEPFILDSDVGYSTSGSSGGGGRLGCRPPGGNGITSALQQVRRALDNLASHPELMKAAGPASEALRNADTVAAWLAGNDPAVVSLVVTGPTENVAKIMEASGADAATQLDVDFWNWEG